MATCPDTRNRTIPTIGVVALSAGALTIAVFPYAWLGKIYRPFGQWMDTYFWAESAHHVAHTVDFVGVSIVLLSLYASLRRNYLLFILSILAVAGIQEGLQLMYKKRLVAWNDGKDVVVDVVAATAAYLVFMVARRIRRA